MLDYLKRLFGFSKPEQAVEAPYKIETPEPKKCGCGRSETGNCVGLHAVSDADWATHEKNPNKTTKAPAKAKAPAKKRTFVKREEGGTAKVAKVKAPAKPKAPAKSKTKKA